VHYSIQYADHCTSSVTKETSPLRVFPYKITILEKYLLTTIILENSRDFLDSKSDMKIYIIEHQATENMLGILSAGLVREAKNIANL